MSGTNRATSIKGNRSSGIHTCQGFIRLAMGCCGCDSGCVVAIFMIGFCNSGSYFQSAIRPAASGRGRSLNAQRTREFPRHPAQAGSLPAYSQPIHRSTMRTRAYGAAHPKGLHRRFPGNLIRPGSGQRAGTLPRSRDPSTHYREFTPEGEGNDAATGKDRAWTFCSRSAKYSPDMRWTNSKTRSIPRTRNSSSSS